MNNLLKQCLWQISFQYDFEKLLSLLYQVFKSTIRFKKWGQTDRRNDRMTTKVLKTRPRIGAVSPTIPTSPGDLSLLRFLIVLMTSPKNMSSSSISHLFFTYWVWLTLKTGFSCRFLNAHTIPLYWGYVRLCISSNYLPEWLTVWFTLRY